MARIPPSTRITTRWNRRLLVLGLIIVIAAITAAALLYQGPKPAPSTFSPPSATGSPVESPPREHKRADRNSARGEAGGALPDGVTVFDERYPAVANLDPDLLKALRRAAGDAADDGIKFFVNSGWRSPERQKQLLREAVLKYGSKEEAARWVATAETSSHVSGDAVDIGESNATAWLSEHGAEYGLCQIYRNEPWHYELRTGAVVHGCPKMYADPTQDPRMHQ